jgi:hypothetical protein
MAKCWPRGSIFKRRDLEGKSSLYGPGRQVNFARKSVVGSDFQGDEMEDGSQMDIVSLSSLASNINLDKVAEVAIAAVHVRESVVHSNLACRLVAKNLQKKSCLFANQQILPLERFFGKKSNQYAYLPGASGVRCG